MSYLLKTYTHGEYEITDEQEKKLRSMDLDGRIDINGSTVMVNNIAEITKVKQESRYKKLEYNSTPFTKERYIKALEQMIKGFKEHFDRKVMPLQSKKLLSHMESKLVGAFKMPNDTKFNNPAKSDFSDPMWDFIHN
jgi:hypothetical protein